MRILSLIPEAFGGYGGIALYNRDFLTVLCELPECDEVVALQRLQSADPGPLPAGLTCDASALGGKRRYLTALLRRLAADRSFNLIICAHINLLPLAYLARTLIRAPVLLVIYGIDTWQPTGSALTNRLVRRADGVISISDHTRKRFLSWAEVQADNVELLPNAIHAESYGVGPKDPALLARYGLDGHPVLLTLGRLNAAERYKGVDEMLQVLPRLLDTHRELRYLVVGDGDDRARLAGKARSLGVGDHVIFTGRIDEDEKADHYRLADAFVMPGRGEGFGFVFLEAMACGVPVVGSKLDGSREALRDGELGLLVDPDDSDALADAVLTALQQPKAVPPGLEYFSFPRFAERLGEIVRKYV
ncbi:MAG: glycosyltransferase family 4 protein [Thiohalocapsa sp.]